jgi:hypothetical protein
MISSTTGSTIIGTTAGTLVEHSEYWISALRYGLWDSSKRGPGCNEDRLQPLNTSYFMHNIWTSVRGKN